MSEELVEIFTDGGARETLVQGERYRALRGRKKISEASPIHQITGWR